MEKLEISKKNVYKAFHAAGENPEIQELPTNLFGKDNVEPEKPKDVRDRIKTFQDACKELGDTNPLVFEYNNAVVASNDIKAYLKLRIICTALNEGWQPQFTEDKYRYFAWFILYTQKEYDALDEYHKHRVVCRSNNNANAVGGLVYAFAGYVSSYASAYYASRLAFRNKELAIYAGKQFIELWADLYLW